MNLLASLGAETAGINPWRFELHPEVWVLIVGLSAGYWYMVRVIGPKAVPPGTPVLTKSNKVSFVASMVVMWIASDWPVHDISEEYLYSVHMFQHMMLSYFVPPLALLATPTWLARLIIGDGQVYRWVKRLTHPVVAGLTFNGVVMILHLPIFVNASVDNGVLHYFLHSLVVTSSLLMWGVVCGPIPEFRIGAAGAMIYLFLQSVVPTVPAAWLTFAESPIYEAYDKPARLWGISAVDDQQIAGAVMKIAGGLYLWGIVIWLYTKKFASTFSESHNYRRGARPPDAEIVGHEERPLTTADTDRAFASSEPPTE